MIGADARELLDSIVAKSGGRDKWDELLAGMRRICKARDKAGIAAYARRASRTDSGGTQLVMLALLGLSLGKELLPSDVLSKRDADALGVADMTGGQLRMRVFQMEGLVAELALTVEEMLRRFAPDEDGLGEAEIACRTRALEVLETTRERYGEVPR